MVSLTSQGPMFQVKRDRIDTFFAFLDAKVSAGTLDKRYRQCISGTKTVNVNDVVGMLTLKMHNLTMDQFIAIITPLESEFLNQ